MVEGHDEIAELDLNPVVATPRGTLIVDARVRVESPPAKSPWPSTWTSTGSGSGPPGTE
jgi:hypothetical protein